jgi:hypothetical protein
MLKQQTHIAHRHVGDREGWYRPLCGQRGRHLAIAPRTAAATCKKCRVCFRAMSSPEPEPARK